MKSKILVIVDELIDYFKKEGINKNDYKNYILWMYFLKYVSDYYEEECSKYLKQTGSKKMLNLLIKNIKYKVDEEASYMSIYNQRKDPDIGSRINNAFNILERDNPKLEGVFQNLDFNNKDVLGEKKQKNKRLTKLIEGIYKIKFDFESNENKYGDDFIKIIYKFATDEGKKGGEFFTPVGVSNLIASLLDPKKDGLLYDPACGSGTLLIEIYKMIKEIGLSTEVYGQEINRYTYGLCKMNMLLNEVNNNHIKAGDIFKNPRFTKNDNELKTFDYVVCDFEFSRKNWCDDIVSPSDDPYNRFEKNVPTKSRGDYGFIMHMLKSLKKDGTMITLIPHGVLFRGDREEKMRKKLLKDNLIDTVVGLPEDLLFGGSIPSALLIIKKNRKNKDVLFIDASGDDFYKSDGNKNILTNEAFDKIVDVKKNRIEVEKFSHLATFEEIKENNYNLNIPRYVDTFEEEELIDIVAVNNKILEIEDQSKKLKEEMQNILKNLELID
jgi:type I restriction enzyme M protein